MLKVRGRSSGKPRRTPVLRTPYRGEDYLVGGGRAAAEQARYYFGLNADPSLEEIRTVAEYYPMYRVVYADEVLAGLGDTGSTRSVIGGGAGPPDGH